MTASLKVTNYGADHPHAIIRGRVAGYAAVGTAELTTLGITVISATISANTDNWNPTGLSTAGAIRATLTASWNLTGIVAPSDDRLLILDNIGGGTLTLKHDTTSTAANRFLCPGDADATIPVDGWTWLQYDITSARWRVLGSGGGSGGNEVYYVPAGFTGADIQAANDAAHTAGGGVVYCPAGTYTVGTAIALDTDVTLMGAGREATILQATANSINIVSVTGTAIDSTFEVAHASPVMDIGLDANGHTGVEGIAFIGVAYFSVVRCLVRGCSVGLDFYGSLQAIVYDTKVLSCTTGIKYTAQTIGYYGGTLPPNRVQIDWSTFYYNTGHAVDFSGGQQLIINASEFGDNGTAANAATSAIKFAGNGDPHGPGLQVHDCWIENNHGLAAIEIADGSSILQHVISDSWFAYTDATYGISVDGTSFQTTLVCDRVMMDTTSTTRTFRRTGSNVFLDLRNCSGVLAGSGGVVRQDPLLDETKVIDLSQMSALRLPNLTTTQRNALTATEGMLIENTSTHVPNYYDGSAWQSITGTTSPLTTKGDVWGYSSTDARIPIGADGQVLTADSTQTLGLKWAASASDTSAWQHAHVENVVYSGDGTTTVFTLPVACVDATSVDVYLAGSRSLAWVLSGTMFDTLTFDSAPASSANNIIVDIVTPIV